MTMNEDIAKYGVFGLTHTGELVRVPVFSTDDYNHYTHHLHHFIKQQDYKKNKAWYDERGIKQKLILLPIYLHEFVHYQGINPGSTAIYQSPSHQLEKYLKNHHSSCKRLMYNSKRWLRME